MCLNGKSRGFGFVTFSTIEEADRAFETMQGEMIHGRPIRIDRSTPKNSTKKHVNRLQHEQSDSHRGRDRDRDGDKNYDHRQSRNRDMNSSNNRNNNDNSSNYNQYAPQQQYQQHDSTGHYGPPQSQRQHQQGQQQPYNVGSRQQQQQLGYCRNFKGFRPSNQKYQYRKW